MARMSRKRTHGKKEERRRTEPSYWMIAAIFAILLLAGLLVKIAFFPSVPVARTSTPAENPSQAGLDLERKVQLVASEFKCACGGCGELPLLDCDCDMPHGALEEKKFIRAQLREGRSVEEVIGLLEDLYGHRIT